MGMMTPPTPHDQRAHSTYAMEKVLSLNQGPLPSSRTIHYFTTT
jgi:hypothetical protein